jgi:hypothetical protein
VIAPDNFEKKFKELRIVMFGELKFKGEDGYDQLNDMLTEELNEENMCIVVGIIFKKAQNEKEYCTFYGDLCERLIRLELNLRG